MARLSLIIGMWPLFLHQRFVSLKEAISWLSPQTFELDLQILTNGNYGQSVCKWSWLLSFTLEQHNNCEKESHVRSSNSIHRKVKSLQQTCLYVQVKWWSRPRKTFHKSIRLCVNNNNNKKKDQSPAAVKLLLECSYASKTEHSDTGSGV